ALGFGQSKHVDVRQLQFPQPVHGRSELSDAAVNHDQVGERAVSLQDAGIVPKHHFLHAGKVVGPLDGPDAKLPVLGFSVNTGVPDDHGCDALVALDVGDVEAFDAVRGMLKVKEL